MKKQKIWQIVLLALIGVATALIWSQSLKSAGQSMQSSNPIALPMAGNEGVSGDLFDILLLLVRKLAHFFEFAVLGVLWGLYSRRRPGKFAWLYGLPVALMDEGLQYFAPGRAPGMWDVVLDYAGYFCGFALVFSIAGWLLRRKSRK